VDVDSLPEDLVGYLDILDDLGWLPRHKYALDAEGDQHWVNFAVDEFELHLPDERWALAFKDFCGFFNFRKEDLSRVKRLNHRVLGKVLEDLEVVRLLKKMLRWMELGEFGVEIVYLAMSLEDPFANVGLLGSEVWRVEIGDILRAGLENRRDVGNEKEELFPPKDAVELGP
jgi:hypothetical protein